MDDTRPLIHRLVDCIGEEAVLRFLDAFAGQRIYIPRNVLAGGKIALAVGTTAAAALAADFGGEDMEVPSSKPWRAHVMRERDGASANQIARALGVTRATAKRYVSGTGGPPAAPTIRTDPRQIALFAEPQGRTGRG